MDDDFLSIRKDGVERPNVVIVHKVTDVVDHDCVMQRFHDIVVQVEVWNQRVTEQLTVHWVSKQT